MSECFRNMDVKLDINPRLKYGDFRDWFIVDPDKPKIHETEIRFFINDHFIYKDMMPINTKNINYIIESNVNFKIYIKSFRWIIPEMELEKETIFDNPTIVTDSDTIKIDGKIDFMIGDI